MDISFNCYVLTPSSDDDSETFPVDIYRDNKNRRYFQGDKAKITLANFKISHLKEHICNIYDIKRVNQRKVKFWRVNVEAERIENNNISTEDDIVHKLEGQKMRDNNLFNEYFKVELANHNKITMGNIHIITIIPTIEIPATDLERKRKAVQEVSGEILRKLIKRPKLTIPEVGSLTEFLDRELPEDLKIPISQNEMDLLQSRNVTDLCSLEDLRVLFRISDTESATDFCMRAIFSPILNDKIPLDDGTEYSFVELWDNCIRNLLEHLIPDGVSIRNSNKFTSTRDDRPDYGLILSNVCPFRGEEKSFISIENPKSELGRKLVWTYDPAPYVLGYYANGPMVTFVAICPPATVYAIPDVVDIVQSNLKLRSGRVRHLLRMINLSCIINALQPVIGRRGIPEFKTVYRNDRTIEIRGTGVKKTYTYENIESRVQKLVNIYEKLARKGVPNIDHLNCFSIESGVVHLSPKGEQVKPSNQQELFEAITCVLEALVVLHDDNDPIYHRDIRWDNIIRRYDDPSKWFLIDWDDATEYPNSPATNLTAEEHAPEVFTRNHRGEVDIWSVGKLIKNATWITNLSEKITEFGDLLLSQDSKKRPSAEKALKKFKKIEKKILKEKMR